MYKNVTGFAFRLSVRLRGPTHRIKEGLFLLFLGEGVAYGTYVER